MLDKFRGILVGRPKAWEFDKQNSPEQRTAYRADQRATVLKTVRHYNKTIPIVQNLDFGHTDPQILLPMGNKARINCMEQRLFLTY